MLMAAAILTTIVTGAVSSGLGAVLLVALLALVALSVRPMSIPTMRRALPDAAHKEPTITRAARDAMNRVSGEVSLLSNPYLLQDVGLVIDEQRADGVALRRARFITLDDESLRPYVVMHYPHGLRARQVLLRFEITDAAGKPQYIYEVERTVDGGENLILPDYRLPLKSNNGKLNLSSAWNLRVSVDGDPMGAHHFNLLPALSERLKQAGPDGEVDAKTRLMAEEQDEALPLSLEELLSRSGN
jgi:hypothetical protein